MNVIAIGDLHFKPKTADENENAVIEILEIIKIIKPRFVVVLGDTLDTHERINVKTFDKATKFFKEISEMCELYIIIGNHDRPNNEIYLTDEHAFNPLKEWKDTFVVDVPLSKKIDNFNFLFVPYVFRGRFMEAIENINAIQDHKAVFCHQEFYGAQMKNYKSKDGDKWPLTYPLVISGHIHTYHIPQENIIYVGSPSDGDDRRISLFTFTDDSYKFERIKLKYRKRNEILVTCDNIDTIDKSILCDKINSVTIKGTKEELKILKKKMASISKDLVYKTKHVRPNSNVTCNMPFIDKVIDEIKNDEELMSILLKVCKVV